MTLSSAAGILALIVAVVYLIIGLLIIPGLRFPLWASVSGTAIFTVCALTHVHIAAEAFGAHGEPFSPTESWMHIAMHVPQAAAGAYFIAAITRQKLVVRLEDE